MTDDRQIGEVQDVQALKRMIAPSKWFGAQIVYLYFDDCEGGIQVPCSTDASVNFCIAAKPIEIEEQRNCSVMNPAGQQSIFDR